MRPLSGARVDDTDRLLWVGSGRRHHQAAVRHDFVTYGRDESIPAPESLGSQAVQAELLTC